MPEKDARKVMLQLTGIRFKGRTVRCNDAEDKQRTDEGGRHEQSKKQNRNERPDKKREYKGKKDDWRSLMNKVPHDLRGEEPDFSEEGWARRKPRKK